MTTFLKKISTLLVGFSLLIGIGMAMAPNKAPTEANAISSGTYTYDFVTKFSTYAAAWDTTYASRTINSTDVEVSTGALPVSSFVISLANKQVQLQRCLFQKRRMPLLLLQNLAILLRQ